MERGINPIVMMESLRRWSSTSLLIIALQNELIHKAQPTAFVRTLVKRFWFLAPMAKGQQAIVVAL